MLMAHRTLGLFSLSLTNLLNLLNKYFVIGNTVSIYLSGQGRDNHGAELEVLVRQHRIQGAKNYYFRSIYM